MIFEEHGFDKQYYSRLEEHFKKVRTMQIDPNEKHLDKEVPIRVLKKYSNFFKSNDMLFLMYETNIYIADKLCLDKHYDSSISWYMEVLDQVKHLTFYNKTPHVYNSIGVCEFKKTCYNDALYYYMKAKVDSSKQSNKELYSRVLHNIALTYLYLNDYDNASDYIEELLTLYSDDKKNFNYPCALILKAQLYACTNLICKSVSICELLSQNINEYDNKTKEQVYIFFAYLYYKIRNKNAIYYGELALRSCMQSKNYDLIVTISKMLDTTYRYYHRYTYCYDNLNSLITFVSADKLHRKYCNLHYFDLLLMKIRLIHYKCLSLTKLYNNI